MKKIGTVTLSMLLTIAAMNCRIASAASISETLQQGLYAEEVEGNINAAIQTYAQVIASRNAPPNLVAQALYRQGMCYLKIKDEPSARAALEKLVAEFPEQTEIVDKARPVLDDLTSFDPAALMPPGTLLFMEFGSPGRQIETILTMLKGTPYENPLAAIGRQPTANPAKKSPGDIMAALLNPSMMAEFKKIRGSAIGVTGIANNNPPMISVLYPGKSDALRGLILAGLGMVGTPGEAIEGMQTVTIKNAGAAAYDDKVIIVAQPASQLPWCVKQYKGLSSEPTLASSNQSFAKLSKNQRQKNALTVWANVEETYAQLLKMFPNGKIPPQIISANAIADFSNIDDVVLTESVESNGLSSAIGIQFKDAHHSLAYDMIRTPNLSKSALEAVPAEAIAVASFALNQTDSAQAEKVRAQIQNVTGLDVGREIFANIEQVTVFALPAEGNSAGAALPEVIPGRLGLAITSRNPEQTQQVLGALLGIAAARSSGQKDAKPGQYKLVVNGRHDLTCYLEQVNGITLLALNREVIDASVAALKSHKSICASGPLNDAVNRLSPTASKLLLVNAGGAMRLLRPQMKFETLNDEQTMQLNASLEQLASAADLTTIELRTDEQPNTFALNSEVTGIPPLNQVLGPAKQIAQLTRQARTEATARRLRQESPATIFPAVRMPVIDGKVDDVWNDAKAYKIANVMYEPPKSSDDLSADYKAMWDENNLYLLVDVTDDILKHDTSPEAWYESDSVEVYIDVTDSKSAQYGQTDYQYGFNWDETSPQMQELRHGRTNGVQYALVTTDKGYRVEIKLPWSTLGTKPSVGAKIGLDIQVNDNDAGGKRKSKIAWHAREDNAWENPQAFGNAELAGLVGWWKFDEAGGTVAADSSGNGHNGSLQGNPVWRPQGGRLGGAIEFGGHGDYVKIDNESAFDITGQITISAWVNITSVPQEWTGIVTKGDSAWRMSTESAQNAFHFGVAREDYLNGRTNVSPGQWHHVVCTYDGQKMSTYVDGRLDVSRPRNGPIGTNDFPVCIGENIELTGHCWHGLIDDVRIYNYALSESQIKALANGQKRINN
jgi:hypothetical protein